MGRFGPLAVFLCPAVVSRWAWGYGHGGAKIAQRVLAQQAVGELDLVKWQDVSIWRLERGGSRIWDSKAGPGGGGVSSLAVKAGNRGAAQKPCTARV